MELNLIAEAEGVKKTYNKANQAKDIQLPRNVITKFNDAVNALSGDAQQAASNALHEVIKNWDGKDIAVLREQAIEALDLVSAAYTDISATYGAEFYAALRELQEAEGYYDAVAYSAYDKGATEGAVRSLIQDVVDTGETDKFVQKLIDRTGVQVLRSANMSIAHNTKRDPAKPRYARVPSGETCGFCLMLSSFGFHWRSEEAASHAHKNCDCRVVPQFKNTLYVGDYWPDDMYSKTQEAIKACGGESGLRKDFYALPKEQRDAYMQRHGNKTSEAINAYRNGQITKYIEQNRDWFLDI